MANSVAINTVIFDMDGLLIDSEPLWEIAGSQLLKKFGCNLTHNLYKQTTGLRTTEWVEHWVQYFGLKGVDMVQCEQEIINHVHELVSSQGKVLPGVPYIFDFFSKRNFNMALATSSPLSLAQLVINKLQLTDYLKTVTSAQHLPYGKPHPQVYINCAEALGVSPLQCVCFEDSFNGMIAAKAAKMKCVVVPVAEQLQAAQWGAADLKIASLQNFNNLLLQQL